MKIEQDNYYNEISDGYNNLYKEEQDDKCKFIFSRYNWNELFKNLELKEKINILDLGCGTGISTLNLIEELNKYKKFKDKKINIILIDPAKLLLEKIILIEKGEMYHDPKMENENYTVIDLNEYELDITISKINMYGENLNDINFECDFLFSLTALQNVSNLNKIIEIIKNKKIKNFILSYLYRGKENELDKVIELFEKLEFKKLLKNNKDIFFVK